MSGAGGGEPLPEIRDALSRLREGLDQLARTVGRLAPGAGGEPIGELLGEEERRRLMPLESLLAVSPGMDRGEALVLVVDRAIHRAGAECAAIFVPAATGGLEVAARRGVPAAVDRVAGREGIVGRAFTEREVVRAGPVHRTADRLLGLLGVQQALAVPVRLPGEPPLAVLLAGRRRAVPFEPEALETLVWLADRAAVVLGERQTTGGAAALLAADLDLARTATNVAHEAARRLGASAVALLLPDESGVGLAAGVGLPAEATPPPLTVAPLAQVLRTGAPWVGSHDESSEALTGLLGTPARLVMPLAAGDRTVALLVAGGSGPLEPGALGGFLGLAATALWNARLYASTLAALAELRALDRGAAGPPPAPVREFGNLLAILLARIALVRERLGEHPSAREDLAVAEEAAWRAAEAVRGFLGFAPGNRRATLVPLDLTSVVRFAVEAAVRRWAVRGAAPVIELELPPLPPIRGSAEELREALDHLLENAAEAVPAGSPISLRASWDGAHRVEVAVRDAGVGIDDVARALQPFFSTKGPGRLGLGLPVCQAIAARHRGSLEIESAPGQGTVARLVLPTAAGTPAAAGETEPGRGTARVLIVEDDARVRETLADLLSREGYVALPAGDAREGLELLEREAVDVVLTAHAFADGSGLELARSVKRRRPDTPVILLTAWPGRLDPAVMLASGIDRVIEKPVGAAAVLAALDAALGRRGSVGA